MSRKLKGGLENTNTDRKPPQRILRWQPKNKAQELALRLWEIKDLLFLIGPAGTGKTSTAVYLATKHMWDSFPIEEDPRVMICRPAVPAGEDIGFLKGTQDEKLSPYTQPFVSNLQRMTFYPHSKVFRAIPLGFIQGLTIEPREFPAAILGEAQNATIAQIKMFITRLGKTGKIIIEGDPEQSFNAYSGFMKAMDAMRDHFSCGIVEFTERDQCRHPLVTHASKYL